MKILFVISGLISLAVGILGVFLPLLPATPFLLFSAWLFAKSSDKLYNWLMNHKILGTIIRDYRDEKSLTIRIKITAIILLWGSMLYSIFYVVNEKLWLQLILATIATGVTIHLLLLKTKKAAN
ncbi:MAG: YbaN family protein [Paludibacter sp.]